MKGERSVHRIAVKFEFTWYDTEHGRRGYRTIAIYAALIGMGGAVGFIFPHIYSASVHIDDEAQELGRLLVAWIVLIPVGCVTGIAAAKLVSNIGIKMQSKHH
jgi:hypothetical protein